MFLENLTTKQTTAKATVFGWNLRVRVAKEKNLDPTNPVVNHLMSINIRSECHKTPARLDPSKNTLVCPECDYDPTLWADQRVEATSLVRYNEETKVFDPAGQTTAPYYDLLELLAESADKQAYDRILVSNDLATELEDLFVQLRDWQK